MDVVVAVAGFVAVKSHVDVAEYATNHSLLTLDLPCEINRAWGFKGDDLGLDDDVDTKWLMRRAKLQARVADPPSLSYLTLTLRGDDKEKGIFPIIHTVDNNLIIFRYQFPESTDGAYIIYDTSKKELSMIPTLARPSEVAHTTRILVARHHAAAVDDGSYSLVLMGRMAVEEDKQPVVGEEEYEPVFSMQDVLFICPSSSSSSSLSPWELIKKAVLPDDWLADKAAFAARATFSFEGHAFWADLLHGVLFCRCSDLLSDQVQTVPFDYIDLPSDTFHPHSSMVACHEAYRTMGRAGNTIKFVSVNFRGCVKRGTPKITVWCPKSWVIECILDLRKMSLQNPLTNMTAMFPIATYCLPRPCLQLIPLRARSQLQTLQAISLLPPSPLFLFLLLLLRAALAAPAAFAFPAGKWSFAAIVAKKGTAPAVSGRVQPPAGRRVSPPSAGRQLCKIDPDGKIRKVVRCSYINDKNYGEASEG
uniref:DUF1618 domain-containing protein n=1 Tax=Leersia perrieri TaxID=77586 RepID=A0A0D9VZX1_9ORYZ